MDRTGPVVGEPELPPGAAIPAPRAAPGDAPRTRARPAARAAVAVLLAASGFAIPVTISAAGRAAPAGTTTAGLVDQLATAGAENRRLSGQLDRLQGERATLAAAAPDPDSPATAAARASTLAVLAGAVPVAGPGITMTVTDPRGNVGADVFVDALQELRDAGAEAIELAGVRLVAESYIVDGPGGGLLVDGVAARAPYRLVVVGDPHTLAEAMRFPGGVLDTVAARDGAEARVAETDRAEIRAVRRVPSPATRPAG
ncbi:DUF881 domain-containing protein [Pseudofrankia sp. DC12]|uniref:DUF881 domain-containing protein n=1 Tax=Pseudofrankia sp. DC12 TaxID=683315 RepID=UPI000697B2A4|nr:DUF881 domain-containing protein [Pseudofrankia sp. DC12]